MHSYSNKSSGKGGKGFIPIKDFANPKPPAGASNSYEQVRKKIDAHDASSLSKMPYTREKMNNK